MMLANKRMLRFTCLAWITATTFISLFGILNTAMAQSTKYTESPALAALVKQGSLPPVVQRLPLNPRIITPVERVGEYGGVWRSGLRGGSDGNWIIRLTGYEPLLAWDREWSGKLLPNVAESYTVNANATEFTFKLRSGMKWSDGRPFTADDIVFFINDIVKNKDLFPNPPSWLVKNGKAADIVKIDEVTFKIKFSSPYGLFPTRLALPYGAQMTMMAKHYCSKFHPAYNKSIASAKYNITGPGWTELFIKRCALDMEAIERWQNPDRPVLEAWKIRQPYIGGASVVTLERNPYYWKVDTAGNQLPYIDGHRIDVGSDVETLVLKAINGEIDYQDRHINKTQNKAAFIEGQKAGNYRVIDLVNSSNNSVDIALNLTHQDSVKRVIFNNKEFRIALSHAIDRGAIIDAVFIGQGEPWQAAPRRESPVFNERLAKQYTKYDVTLANRILDKLGYKKNSQGWRIGPDGKIITINIMAIPAHGDFVDAVQLVSNYWKAIGIDSKAQVVDRTLFFDRKNRNDYDAAVWNGDGGMADAILDPRWYFPFYDQSLFAIPWANWWTKNAGIKEQPPAAVEKQQKLYDKLVAEIDQEKQKAIFKQILDISAEQFYAIGISTPPSLYAIVKNNMRNVPSHTWAWIYPSPAAAGTEQFFLRH